MNNNLISKAVPHEQKVTNHIIEILSNEFPLTTKQIYNKLKRNYGVNVTYQAVHKHVKQLLEQKVLSKDKNKLFINYVWIKNLSVYAKNLAESIEKGSGENESRLIIANSLIECGKFLVNEFSGNSIRCPNPENKDGVCMWNFAWSIVGASNEEHERMKETFSKTTHWNVFAHNTFLDNVTADYVRKLGKKVAMNKKFSMNVDTFVEGDYILQAHFPEELKQEMKKLYFKVKSEKDFDMKEMFEFGSKKHEIKITIFKSPELADSLREEAKKIYEESLKEKRK